MVRSTTLEAFRRSLNARFGQLQEHLGEVVNVKATKGADQHRLPAIEKFVGAARDLHDYLDVQERPAWLVEILRTAGNYFASPNPAKAEAFLQSLLKNYRDIKPIEFDDDAPLVDFDELFAKYRDEGKLPDLFDELIRLICQILESGEVDSVAMRDALEQLLLLLRANRSGSFFGIVSTIASTEFFVNLFGEFMNDVTGLKQFKAAYEKTVGAAKDELRDAEMKAIRAMLTELSKRSPKLLELPNYNSQTVVIVSPLLLDGQPDSDDRIIDAEDCTDPGA
jgi:hypothetical protein